MWLLLGKQLNTIIGDRIHKCMGEMAAMLSCCWPDKGNYDCAEKGKMEGEDEKKRGMGMDHEEVVQTCVNGSRSNLAMMMMWLTLKRET